MIPIRRHLLLLLVIVSLFAAGCSSDWSDADYESVQAHCDATAEDHSTSCSSWVDGIYRLSDCDPDQAKRVIDRIVAEYNGATARSIAENYERVGCAYGRR